MSKELPTIILPHDRWSEIEHIEAEAFDDIMPPTPRQTAFLAAVAGNSDLAGHLRVEQLYDFTALYHLVHVYTKPDHRNRASLALQLMTEAAECIPEGFSGIWLTRKPYPQLAKALGAQELGQFWTYRRDN